MIFQHCVLHFHRVSLKSSSFLGEKLGYGGSYYCCCCCQEGQEKMSRKKFVLRWHGPKMKINLTPETVLEKGFESWVAWRFQFLWIFTTTSSALENSVALKKDPNNSSSRNLWRGFDPLLLSKYPIQNGISMHREQWKKATVFESLL